MSGFTAVSASSAVISVRAGGGAGTQPPTSNASTRPRTIRAGPQFDCREFVMRLERDTSGSPASAEKEITKYAYSRSDTSKIWAYFDEFGGQNSEFWVHLDWDDVERAIQTFAELGNENTFRFGMQSVAALAERITGICGPEIISRPAGFPSADS
jgi:hypothetical protein